MPGEEEALRLLEERKRVHIPDDSQKVIPSKKRVTKKKKSGKERKRKRLFFPWGERSLKGLPGYHTNRHTSTSEVGGRGDVDSPG